MSAPLIYPPKYAAAEYAGAALNIYQGCAHGCLYSYNTRRMSPEGVLAYRTAPRPRQAVLKALDNGSLLSEASSHARARHEVPVFLSFTSDPYQPIEGEHQLTRRVLEVLLEAGCNVMILTKAGALAQRDFDLLSRQGYPASTYNRFGTTLTSLSARRARLWEPGAALPIERIANLRRAKAAGLTTCVSLEPVIYPDATIQAILASHHHTDHYAVGKLNHWSLARVQDVDPEAIAPDWPAFRQEVSALLESLGYRPSDTAWPNGAGRTYYLKEDLRRAR